MAILGTNIRSQVFWLQGRLLQGGCWGAGGEARQGGAIVIEAPRGSRRAPFRSFRAGPRDPDPRAIKRVDSRGSSALLPLSMCRPRPPPPHFRRGCDRGGALASRRAAAGGGGTAWARPAVRAGAGCGVRAACCCPGLWGPSVPPAPWAIATRWGPTRRWWFQGAVVVPIINSTCLVAGPGHGGVSPTLRGTLTVEQIYQDRDQFAKLVREVAAPDVGRMGIEILSFTIKDVYDKVDYLSSLGKTQTAVVQRDADIGVAEAERDAGIREAECKKEMLDVKFMADTKIADSKRAFELQKSAFSEEVNVKTAEAQLAYELQGAREQQKIRQEEIEIEVVQRKKQIAVETQEILRTDKELIATVRRPAEAEAHRIQQIAEGEKVKQVLLAQAEAEKIRKIGEAEAAVIEAMGKAEAERMKLKAEAYQKYGDSAKMALVLEALPQIAAKVAAPLTKVDEIVVLSGDNNKVTSEVNRLLAELPASVHALTGVDLSKIPLIKKATGAQV
ncbi:flotillin-2 isoform 1-T1 [Molossus nigricans]